MLYLCRTFCMCTILLFEKKSTTTTTATATTTTTVSGNFGLILNAILALWVRVLVRAFWISNGMSQMRTSLLSVENNK